MHDLLKVAAEYEAHLKKTAAGGSLEERLTKLYEAFIKETGEALPKAIEDATKSMVKLAVVKPRADGLKFQLSFDGYRLTGGRGENHPDFIGRVVIDKKVTNSNFLTWEVAIQGVGRRGEATDKGGVDSGNSPTSLASGVAYALKRALQTIM